MNKEKIEKAIKILLKEDRFYDDETEIKATKVLLKYIKELEQKESILDKVTDIVKLIIKRTEAELMYGTTDMLEDLQKILNIIEGGI